MVEIDLILPPLLCDATGLPRHGKLIALTLSDAIDRLRADRKISPHVFDDHGKQRQHVLIFYNEENTRWIKDHNFPLKPGDTLQVVQAISGG